MRERISKCPYKLKIKGYIICGLYKGQCKDKPCKREEVEGEHKKN